LFVQGGDRTHPETAVDTNNMFTFDKIAYVRSQVQVLPAVTSIQKTFSPDRVTIFVNSEGRVVRVPKIG